MCSIIVEQPSAGCDKPPFHLNAPGADEADVLETFDFDSFLTPTDGLNWSCRLYCAEESAPLDHAPDLLQTPMHALHYSVPPRLAEDPKVKILSRLAEMNATSYLIAIIKIHKTFKSSGLTYPDDFQNQLLTASRMMTIISTHLEQSGHSIATGTLRYLESDLEKCKTVPTGMHEEMPSRDAFDSVDLFHQTWKSFRCKYEKCNFEAIVPLFAFCKHLNWYEISKCFSTWSYSDFHF